MQNEVYTCGVILYELLQGTRKAGEEKQVITAFSALKMLQYDTSIWIKAAKISANLRCSGLTLPFSDILIAAIAIEHNLVVLTIDTHFQHIPDVTLYSW